MIQLKSFLNVIDNSGARIVECINCLGRQKSASLGDEIVVAIKKAKPIDVNNPNNESKVKKGDVRRALIVRTKREVRRSDGTYIKFNDNACVLLDKQGQMVGNRINGIIAEECRKKKWLKVVSLAPLVI
jgi:ribosomal protein L14